MLRQRRGHRFHRSAGIACRTGGDPEAGEAPAVRQHAYRRGDADSHGKGAGATRLQDRGLPYRIADGLRAGHARLVRRVEEQRSRGQTGYAGNEFCRGEEVAGRGGVLKASGKALRGGEKGPRILSSIRWNSANFAPYGFLYIHLGPALDCSRPCNHASPARVPRSDTDQGKSEIVYHDSDMGGHGAPNSDPGVVGRLRDAQERQLDIFGAPRNHAASDQHLHDRRACFAGH